MLKTYNDMLNKYISIFTLFFGKTKYITHILLMIYTIYIYYKINQ
jgi:hypothetical protein